MTASKCVTVGLFRLPRLILFGVLLLFIPNLAPAADFELQDWKRLKYEAVTDDPIDILRMIAEKSEANYQQIKTWSAAFRFQDKAAHFKIEEGLAKALSKAANRDLDGATVYSTTSGTIEFEIDISKESFYSRKVDERCVITDPQNGQVLADLNQEQDSLPVDEESKIDMLNTWNAIVTPEQSIHMQPDTSYQNGRTAFREPRENGLRWGTLVDPRQLFGEGIPHWEMARNAAKILEVLASDQPPKEKGLQELLKAKPKATIKQAKTDDGPIYWVRFEARTLETGVMRTDYRFDGRVGFNLVQSRTTTNGRVVSDMEWSYIKSEDVFVPKSLIKMMSDSKTGKLAYQRNLDFKSCKVNGPLHPDGFGYKRLGLKDGERVVDRIKKAVYVLDGKDLKPVVEQK
jgi:hypothetical protein